MKNRKRKPIDAAKNAIRGTFNTPKSPYLNETHRFGAPNKSGVDLILGGLASIPVNDTPEFLAWLSGFPSKTVRIFPNAPVRKPSSLNFSNVQTAMSLANRVQLMVKLLQDQREKISDFWQVQTELERQVFLGEFENALSVLDRVSERFGLSLWAIELRIALLQAARGLEAQKEFAGSFGRDASGSAAAVVAYWVSQRNEEGTIYARFQSRLRSSMSGWKIPPTLTLAYSYLLGVETFGSLGDEEASSVLASVCSVSIIDAYMTVRDALSSLSESGELPSKQALDSFSSLTANSDALGERLLFLHQPTAQAAVELDREATGADSLLEAILSAPHVAKDELPEFAADIARLVTISIGKDPGFAQTIDAGLKRLANFRHLDAVRAASSFITLQSSELPVFSLSRGTGVFLFSRTLHPWQAVTVPSECAKVLLSVMKTRPLTTEVNNALSGDLEACGVSPVARELFARKSLADGTPRLALKALAQPVAGSRDERRMAPIIVAAHLELGELENAVSTAGSLCANAEGSHQLLPLARIVSELKSARFEIDDKLSLALVLFEYLQVKEDREVFQQLQFAYEDALTAHGFDRPSQLAESGLAANSPAVKIFLRNVCIPAVMDVSFWLFKTSRDTLRERIAVCSSLALIDTDFSADYRDEIKEITRVIDIEEGIEDVDRSRVFVDLIRLGRWASKELAESFERYKALARAKSGFDDPGEFEKLVKDFLAGKDVSGTGVMLYPKDEQGQLLIEIIDSVVYRYFNDEEFGLDAYLSMRVRHGSLAGHLRGPLEEAGILVARDKATGKFSIADEWREFEKEIERFSAKYEQLVDDLTKVRLQIRAPGSPDGLFGYEMTPLSVYYVRSGIDASTTLDELLQKIYEVLDVFLHRSLQQVRSYLTGEFREKAEQALARLDDSSPLGSASQARVKLRKAVAEASTDWQASVDRVASWFAPNEKNERAALRTMHQIVEIAIQATVNAHRSFDPKLELEIEDLGLQGPDVLVEVTDILFTILDNAHRHCGVQGNSPHVKIKLWAENIEVEDALRVIINVESEVAPHAVSTQNKNRVNKIREQIRSGDWRSRVKLEGGTGFLKLKRIVAPDNRQSLDFYFTDSSFVVDVSVVLAIAPANSTAEAAK